MADTINQDAMHEGEGAAKELAEAMQLTGVTLPSLRGDFPAGDRPLVQLGGLSARSARELATWIREHA